MDENTPQVSYANNLAPLADILDEVKRPGDFFAAGSIETPMPLLKVKGAGTVSFPVPAEQCRKLIKSVAERAPYGRGDQTLHDESVRKVWQIAAGKVQVSGKAWTATLKSLLARVETALGRPAGSVKAELYKLLIYDKGGFFKAHRDTEKSRGMFGTLVVSLPSAHSGGDLLIRHAGREVRAGLCASDPGEIRYAAFYADCEHEVRPVTRGNRVCLVYNLLHDARKRSAPTNAPDYREATQAVANYLDKWAKGGDAPNKLVWLLEHQYTEAGLSFAGLKNRDATWARVLRDAAQAAGCAFHLGMFHIEESGWAEYTGGFYGYGRGRRMRYWEDEDDDDDDEFDTDDDDFEIGEVCDYHHYIDQWRDARDRSVAFGEIPLEEGEILPLGALDDEKPDKLHFSEATGNEGASFERTYLRAAVVIWPENRTDLVCAAAGIGAAIERLGHRVTEAKNGDDNVKAAVAILADTIEEKWSEDRDVSSHATSLFSHLARFGDARLIARFWTPVLIETDVTYDGAQNAALTEAIAVLGSKSKEPLLSLIDARHGDLPAACIDLWIRLSRAASSTKSLARVCSPVLSRLLDRLQEPPAKNANRWTWLREDEKPAVNLTPRLVASFLEAVAENSATARKVAVAAEALSPANKRLTTENHILPALELSGKKSPAIPEKARNILWRHCAEDLLSRAEYPPEVPKNWAQKVSLPSKDALLKELEIFARDPQRRVHRFPVRKDLRQVLHRAIEKHQLDMTHVTERKGSPHTLVCTKTHASFHKKCKQHRADKALIKRLLSLADAGRQPSSLVKRLEQAVRRTTPTSKNLPTS